MRLFSSQILLAALGLWFLTVYSAFAETAPVVAVNREIGLPSRHSLTGLSCISDDIKSARLHKEWFRTDDILKARC